MNEFRAQDPGPIAGFAWGAANNFLGLPPEHSSFETARVLVLPVPYEATVSWVGGTKRGPGAIVEASHFVELYDHELDLEPYTVGVHTLPELLLPGSGPEPALAELRRAVDTLCGTGKFVIILGGEHSLSSPPILHHADRLADRTLTVLQFDAHTDLRAEYEDTPFSHACVMHRVHERVRIVPVGIRSMTAEERALVRRLDIPIVFAHEMQGDDWIERTMASLGDEVYITFDVDFFDPSLMPATGTPEPGGGGWYPALRLLERVFRERHVVGCDVVELAPLPGIVAPDFLAAKLVYKLIGFYAATAGN